MGIAAGVRAESTLAGTRLRADSNGGEHFGAAVSRSEPVANGDRDFERVWLAAGSSRTGADRELDHAEPGVCGERAAALEAPRRQHFDRRFRYWVFVACGVETSPDRCVEDRQVVCARRAKRRG